MQLCICVASRPLCRCCQMSGRREHVGHCSQTCSSSTAPRGASRDACKSRAANASSLLNINAAEVPSIDCRTPQRRSETCGGAR